MPNYQKLLIDLVNALDSTYWSSWQSTSSFSSQLDAAREALLSPPEDKIALLKALTWPMGFVVESEFRYSDENWGLWVAKIDSTPDKDNERPIFKFNPLTSDADYAMVEAKFNCETKWFAGCVLVWSSINQASTLERYENHPDKLTARRHAGVKSVVEGYLQGRSA